MRKVKLGTLQKERSSNKEMDQSKERKTNPREMGVKFMLKLTIGFGCARIKV